jgi:hypothetical protein
MKSNQFRNIKNILLLIFFFSINIMSAQFGNQGYGGGYGNGGGIGNSGYGNSGMNQMGQPQNEPEKPKEIPAEVTAKVVVDKIKAKLMLDELQEIAIANIITKSIQAQGVILKKGNSDEDKMEDVKVLSENTDRKIMEMLNKDQKEKYKELIDDKHK